MKTTTMEMVSIVDLLNYGQRQEAPGGKWGTLFRFSNGSFFFLGDDAFLDNKPDDGNRHHEAKAESMGAEIDPSLRSQAGVSEAVAWQWRYTGPDKFQQKLHGTHWREPYPGSMRAEYEDEPTIEVRDLVPLYARPAPIEITKGMRSANDAPLYVIWSHEHGAWWRAEASGYTTHLAAAGRYSRSEAIAICATARNGWREGKAPDEIPVLEADALACNA